MLGGRRDHPPHPRAPGRAGRSGDRGRLQQDDLRPAVAVVVAVDPDEAVVVYGSWSFPSGHANNAALGAILLVTLLALVRTAWIRWGATALVVVGALLTAADRIVLGVHYVTDVTAGMALGALMALVGLGVLRPDLRPPPATDA